MVEAKGKVQTDFSEDVKTAITNYVDSALKDNSLLPSSLSKLLKLEKKTRLAVAIVELCFKTSSWNLLNEHISMLCKQRAEIRSVIGKVIETSFHYVYKAPKDKIKLTLIKTLREVSEGKLHAEV